MSVHAESLGAAALVILAERGARGFTHRAVDQCAGVPEGTASRYARTRAALLDLAAEALLAADSQEALMALMGDGTAIRSPDDVVTFLVQVTLALMSAPQRFRARVELQLEAERSATLRAHFRRGREAFAIPLANVLGAIGYREPRVLAEVLMTMIDGIQYQSLIPGADRLCEVQLRQLIGAAVHSRGRV